MTTQRDIALLGDSIHNLPHHLLPPCQYEYKGGAKYYGDIVDFKAQGRGILTYPDGDLYEGFFKIGVKDGEGTQKWFDGSYYEGPFKEGKRHGRGVHQWSNGEVYEGQFVDDIRCGEGVYTWPNGDTFIGTFLHDMKEGDGVFKFSNGNVYKGHYSSDTRLGPGTMTYSNATQDVGRWRGCSLTKLSNSFLPASIMDIEAPEPDCDMCDMREVTQGFTTCDRAKGVGPMGPLEAASQALQLAAIKGDNAAAVYLLQHTCVRPDVCDTNGLTPLHAAAVFSHDKIVNILLDNGADVNQLTDSGVSPLVACHLHLYFNTLSGYQLKNRTEPIYKSLATDTLDGPLDVFEQLKLSTKILEEEAEEEEEEKEKEEEEVTTVPSKEERPGSACAKTVSRVTSTMTDPADKEGYCTVVVYGKRYFVKECEVFTDLQIPEYSTLPTNPQLRSTIKLLLRRGADPKIGQVPAPALILAILSRDTEAVELLLSCGAAPTSRLGQKYGYKSPLHVAAGLKGPGAPVIVKLLLEAGADPNVTDSLTFSRSGELHWKLVDNEEEPGTTPLQVACSMDHDYPNTTEVIRLLLAHNANTNVICSGHSPLTLAIYSGNDTALRLLLKNGANPSLPLGAPVGSALCAAVDTTCEHRRSNEDRLEIINELMSMGGDIMALVPVGKSGKHIGTAVDYAMHVFYQDKRIAHTPFHALTTAEREIYIARTSLLNHMSTLLRDEVQKREAAIKEHHCDSEDQTGKKNQKPKMLFKYCYECGRSTGVKLSPCTRCYVVSFCSQRCKLKSWTSRHRRECVKLENKQKKEGQPSVTPPKKKEKKEPVPEPEKQTGGTAASTKITSVSKDIFGNTKGGRGVRRGGKEEEGTELITHHLPRLVNLQHSQI